MANGPRTPPRAPRAVPNAPPPAPRRFANLRVNIPAQAMNLENWRNNLNEGIVGPPGGAPANEPVVGGPRVRRQLPMLNFNENVEMNVGILSPPGGEPPNGGRRRGRSLRRRRSTRRRRATRRT